MGTIVEPILCMRKLSFREINLATLIHPESKEPRFSPGSVTPELASLMLLSFTSWMLVDKSLTKAETTAFFYLELRCDPILVAIALGMAVIDLGKVIKFPRIASHPT